MAGESLFSLEVIVESVEKVCTVHCDKPAIAFRLLDFPTVVIRSKHEEFSTNETPRQIQSGKSCLFKMSTDLLNERLQDTPLYIMLIDISSRKTKLLASTTISLVNCFQKILTNIESNGLDVPAVSGSKGEFQMYNLMGSRVAIVKLRYRMFSLGVGITGHVNLSLSKQIKLTDGENIQTKPSESAQIRKDINYGREVTEYSTKGICPDLKENPILQSDVHNQTNQTGDIDTEQRSATPYQKYDNPDSLAVHNHDNISRPPPLYYNRTSTFTKAPRHVPSRKLVENPHYDEMVSRPQYCDTSVQTCETETASNIVPTSQGHASIPHLHDSQVRLPLIEALLNKLSLVRTQYGNNDDEQSMSPSKHSQFKLDAITDTLSNKLQEHKNKARKTLQPKPRTSGMVKSKPTKANSKGVLISRHPVKFKKSSLKYGTTKTQKLREAMSKKNIEFHSEQIVKQPESQVDYALSEQIKEDIPGQDNMKIVSIEVEKSKILTENKSTMTQNGEPQLICKDIGVQVRIKEDNSSSNTQKRLSQGSLLGNDGTLARNVILGATYINTAVPVSTTMVTTNEDGNADHEFNQTYLSPKEVEDPLSKNKLFPKPREFPTYSNISPIVHSSNMGHNNDSETSSKESHDKTFSSGSRLSGDDLGLVNKPVGEILSNSSYSENFDSDASGQS